jgi:hypothetical protein
VGNFWKHFAHVFVVIGKGAVQVGLWASTHPTVIAEIATIAKLDPQIAAAIQVAGPVIGAIEQAHQ